MAKTVLQVSIAQTEINKGLDVMHKVLVLARDVFLILISSILYRHSINLAWSHC